ncbi:hypothetical protein [Rhizobium sp. NRK18]|uniref:hypothetical protein n=1 Tax=Rhizobium sp. NRK18 TaxID=2964667 RepID=UPI0021C2FD8F|nr:hypothetical protein [Rhizobium sp. NRK18]MCQ2005702.1 hypothetical protein [Rhizobium sp. NRK18]
MDDNFEADSRANDADVNPSVTREDLDKTWIGLGAALEWIALRGQPIPRELYRGREEEADEALVATLADLPSEIAEAIVRGEPEEDRRRLVPVPSGIWRQTATSDFNDSGQPYRLIGTDDDDPWEGAILGVQVGGYRRIQIRSSFILENWSEHELDIETLPISSAVARAKVRRLVEMIVAETPVNLAPISQSEMEYLVRSVLPAAQRDLVRQLHREIYPNPKRGPKGVRNPDRKIRIEKFREELISAELRN